MRVSGLATGMDTENIIKELMNAERMPMDKMEQQKTLMEWQRDKYREINTLRQKVDDLALNMRLFKTYNVKTVGSSNENAVTATASPTAAEGSYKIEVTHLATSAINVSKEEMIIGLNDNIFEKKGYTTPQTFTLRTFDENGVEQKHEYVINDGDTLNDLIKRINEDDNPIRMFYDENTKKVVMETTRTGKYNLHGGKEIEFDESTASVFMDIFKMDRNLEKGGTNAVFKYNDAYEVSTKENSYKLNGITFEFKNTNEGQPSTLTVSNNVDEVVDSIKEFVEAYNELIDLMNGTQREEKYRDYPPLTEEQKKELEEREIELWEEKAKSGILKGDPIISSALSNLRSNWYTSVETSGQYKVVTQIGISTTKNYFDGGKLEIDEDKLREALMNDSDSVYKLFAGDENTKGVIHHLESSFDSLKGRIDKHAGRSTDTLTNYTLGKRISDIDKRMEAFQARLERVETRYWRQFTAMEKAISQMNTQSSMLIENFMSN